MIHFTPQESRILIFLIATLLFGSAVSLYRHRRADVTTRLSVISPRGAHQTEDVGSSEGREDRTLYQKVNINTATSQELETLPGVGPQLAQRIIAYRQDHGPFPSAHDITEVRGIGEKTFHKIQDAIIAE